jgi:hypothetical protein
MIRRASDLTATSTQTTPTNQSQASTPRPAARGLDSGRTIEQRIRVSAINPIPRHDTAEVEDHEYAPFADGPELARVGFNRASRQPPGVSPEHSRELNSAGAQFGPDLIAFPVDLSETDSADAWPDAEQSDAWRHRRWPGWEGNYREGALRIPCT